MKRHPRARIPVAVAIVARRPAVAPWLPFLVAAVLLATALARSLQ